MKMYNKIIRTRDDFKNKFMKILYDFFFFKK